MNIQIGSRIKSFRLANSMTQEQLAQKLGVSAQAVSKWESNTNMPDIQLLPDLAVIFGISIDALFLMSDESRMDRIENQLDNVRFLEPEEFKQSEQFLKICMENPHHEARAALLLAQLYNKRAEEYHDRAKPLARKALELNPGEVSAHQAVFDAENGPYPDWDLDNYQELIGFYKEVLEAHPGEFANYCRLLDLLIHDHRLEEARSCAEKMRQVKDSYHYELYMGRICREACDLEGAMDWWQKMTEHEPDNWVVWAEYGDIFAGLCQYDKAVHYYKKAMPLRPRPRFVDCEDAVFHICMIQNDLEGALQMKKNSLQIILEDWTTEGESVHMVQREIHHLQSLLNKKQPESGEKL